MLSKLKMMRSTMTLALLLLCPGPTYAQSAGRRIVTEGKVCTRLLDTAEERAADLLSEGGNTASRQSLDASTLLEQVQRHFIPARQQALSADPGRCGPPWELATQLEKARDAARFDPNTGRRILEQQERSLGCSQDRITREQFARTLAESAEFQWISGAEDKGRMTDAFSVGLSSRPQVFPEHQTRLNRAEHMARARVADIPVTLDRQALAGLVLWVDGAPVTADRINVREGRHLLQLVTPDGKALSASIVRLSSNPTKISWPPENLRPFSREEAHKKLLEALDQEPMPTWLESLVATFLTEEKLQQLLVVLTTEDPGSARSVTFTANQPTRREVLTGGCRAGLSPSMARPVAIAFGACAVAATASAANDYMLAAMAERKGQVFSWWTGWDWGGLSCEEPGTDACNKQELIGVLKARAGIEGGVALGCLTGAVASKILSRSPVKVYKDRGMLGRTRVGLRLGPERAGILVTTSW